MGPWRMFSGEEGSILLFHVFSCTVADGELALGCPEASKHLITFYAEAESSQGSISCIDV